MFFADERINDLHLWVKFGIVNSFFWDSFLILSTYFDSFKLNTLLFLPIMHLLAAI